MQLCELHAFSFCVDVSLHNRFGFCNTTIKRGLGITPSATLSTLGYSGTCCRYSWSQAWMARQEKIKRAGGHIASGSLSFGLTASG